MEKIFFWISGAMYKTKPYEFLKMSLKTHLCACLMNGDEIVKNTDDIMNISTATFQPRMINSNHFSNLVYYDHHQYFLFSVQCNWLILVCEPLHLKAFSHIINYTILYHARRQCDITNLRTTWTLIWSLKLAGKTRMERKNMNKPSNQRKENHTAIMISRSMLLDQIHELNTLIH